MTWHLFIYFSVTFLIRVRVFYRKPRTCIWWRSRGRPEDHRWTRRLQGWLCLWAWEPPKILRGFVLFLEFCLLEQRVPVWGSK